MADWTRLWWVQAQLRWAGTGPAAEGPPSPRALERRYPQYAAPSRVLVFRLRSVTGWSGQVP